MNYCGQCGSKLSEEDSFCKVCGFKAEQNLQEIETDQLQANKPAGRKDSIVQRAFTMQKIPKTRTKHKKIMAICVLAFGIISVFGIYMLFGEQIGTQVSYIFKPGITISLVAQIPEGESEHQMTSNMISIVYITELRLITLGYLKATVSYDNNILTVKHIPKEADINAVVDYITSSSYTAELQDADGNTIFDNTEFWCAFVDDSFDTGIKYTISITLTTEGEQLFEDVIKPYTSQQDGENYVVLIANGERIANIYISSEIAQNGLKYSSLSIDVPDDGQSDLTSEELAKALSSHGALPYALIYSETNGGDSYQTGDDDTYNNDENALNEDTLGFMNGYTYINEYFGYSFTFPANDYEGKPKVVDVFSGEFSVASNGNNINTDINIIVQPASESMLSLDDFLQTRIEGLTSQGFNLVLAEETIGSKSIPVISYYVFQDEKGTGEWCEKEYYLVKGKYYLHFDIDNVDISNRDEAQDIFLSATLNDKD